MMMTVRSLPFSWAMIGNSKNTAQKYLREAVREIAARVEDESAAAG